MGESIGTAQAEALTHENHSVASPQQSQSAAPQTGSLLPPIAGQEPRVTFEPSEMTPAASAENPALAVEPATSNQPPLAPLDANQEGRDQAGIANAEASASISGEADRTAPTQDEPIYNIPIVRDRKVEGHLRFFHTAIRDRFEMWLDRLGRYKPMVDRIFTEFDLPSDLVFLSLVESGFNPHARSRARATGPWQFMKGTAQMYGLRVDQYVDERKDPHKSTVAAARYLRDLYDLFGAWPLAMAAYNAGEGKVQRALQKSNTESFSEIAQTKHLRRETKEYVPRIMAATIIARNPDQFGFSQETPDAHDFEEVLVTRPVHFRDLAKTTGVPFDEFRRLNPELLKDVTPPGDAEYQLKVPVGTKAAIEEQLAQIPAWKPSVQTASKWKSRKDSPVQTVQSTEGYRVRVGDSLATIAKRFRLSVHELKSKNHLTGHRIRPGDLLTVSR